MDEINLDYLVSLLEKMPEESWEEAHWELDQKEGGYVRTFSTQIDCTKIHQPIYRDIPGYYNVVFRYVKEADVGGYIESLSLDLFRNDGIEFSVYGNLQEDAVTKLYKSLRLGPFKNAVAGIPPAYKTGELVSLSEALRRIRE